MFNDIKNCYTSLSEVGDSKIVVGIATLLAIFVVIPMAKIYVWLDDRREAREATKIQDL